MSFESHLLNTVPKKAPPKRVVSFLAEEKGFVCIFIPCTEGNENKCSHQCLHWCQQISTGDLHICPSNPIS